MKNTVLRRGLFSRLTWGSFFVGLLFFTAPSYAEDPRVDSADPSSADQGTYDLEVTVVGDNFGADSEVDFFVTNTEDPGGIKVKKVKRRGPKTLKVTIDVDPDAQTDLDFDIEVRSRGRTGKGTELFRVLKVPKLKDLVWQVEMPDEDMAVGNCIPYLFEDQTFADCNLYASGNIEGTPEWVTFANSDNVEVDVWVNTEPQTGQTYTTFDLTIAESESIGFRNLGFQGCKTMCGLDADGNPDCGGPCTCLALPGENDAKDCSAADCYPAPPCNDPPCGSDYQTMWDFMQGPLHPIPDYDHFSLRFIIWADIDSLDDGPTVFAEAYLWRLNLWNTDQVMVDGDEDDHNVVCAYWIDLEDVVVERSGDQWTVTVNQCGMPGVDGCPGSNIEGQTSRPVVFWETYYQGIPKKKKIDSEYRWALGTGTAFKFVTKWKRISIE